MFPVSNFLLFPHLCVWSICILNSNSYPAKLPDLLENKQIKSLLMKYIEKEIKSLDQLSELINKNGVQISRRSLATYLPEIKVIIFRVM